MPSEKIGHFFVLMPLLLAVAFVPSCETPQKRALKELSKAGIQPSASALVEAVQKQNAKQVGWLLLVGVYTEQRDLQGRTPLRIAIENSDVASAFKLLESGANANATTPDRTSLLGAAVTQGEIAITEKLLAAGAAIDGRTPDGENILPWAIRNGRLFAVRAMMKAGADPHLTDRSGNPLLHVAMASGHREIAASLIDLGADSASINAAGQTTLHLALQREWLDLIPKLAAAGADPNARDATGISLLGQATQNQNFPHTAILLDCGADPNFPIRNGQPLTPLEASFLNDDPVLFEHFLTHHAKPPQADWSPWLWKAFEKGDFHLAHLLLRQGAKASRPGPQGLLLVEAAALARSAPFIKLLLDYGNPAGHALHRACAAGDLPIAELLISCGADPTATLIPTYHTPLSIALLSRQDAIAAALLSHTLEPSRLQLFGQSLFHLAVATGSHRTVKQLLASGADPNELFKEPVAPEFYKIVKPGAARWVLKNDRNVTPLMVAADSGNLLTVRYLIDAGAKKQVRTRSTNIWPINFASRRSDVKMMRLLLGKDPAREERQIVVNLSEQRARVFDAAGNEIFSTKVSTGRKGFSTPTGEFVITNKYRDWTSTIYDASMPYFQRLSCGDFGLHQGNLPGYPASHGCIRVPAGNAAKLFTLTQAGDRVRILP